jgi:hypothetical protein
MLLCRLDGILRSRMPPVFVDTVLEEDDGKESDLTR